MKYIYKNQEIFIIKSIKIIQGTFILIKSFPFSIWLIRAGETQVLNARSFNTTVNRKKYPEEY